MNFTDTISDTPNTHRTSRSFYPLPAIRARRTQIRPADRAIARAAVLEVLG